MEVFCPACSTKNTVDRAGRTAMRARCRACSAAWSLFDFDAETSESSSVPPPSTLAARNETSVLFTVDNLAGLHAAPGTRRARISQTDEDGIIDLNALSSSPPTVGDRSIAPLFASEPPAFTHDVSVPRKASKRRSALALAGAVGALSLVGLAGVGVFVAFQVDPPELRNAATAMIAPAANSPEAGPAPVAAIEPARVAPSAAAGDDGEADEPGKAAHKARVKAGLRAQGKARSGGTKAVMTTSAPAVRRSKATDMCGCKGDFNCIVRCTATGK